MIVSVQSLGLRALCWLLLDSLFRQQHPAIRTTAPNPLERRQLAGIARHLVLALLPLLGPTIVQFLLPTLRQHLPPSDEQASQADADGHTRTRGAEESANPETEPEPKQNQWQPFHRPLRIRIDPANILSLRARVLIHR